MRDKKSFSIDLTAEQAALVDQMYLEFIPKSSADSGSLRRMATEIALASGLPVFLRNSHDQVEEFHPGTLGNLEELSVKTKARLAQTQQDIKDAQQRISDCNADMAAEQALLERLEATLNGRADSAAG